MPDYHSPPFKSPWTNVLLENRDQLCPLCHFAFRNTKAGDAHRKGRFPNRICVEPSKAGLVSFRNKFGTEVWDLSEDRKHR